LINQELKIRPTFRQAVTHFRRNVLPNSAVVKRYKEDDIKERDIDDNVKVLSGEYADLEDEQVSFLTITHINQGG
jgi:hypothetical protein